MFLYNLLIWEQASTMQITIKTRKIYELNVLQKVSSLK